MDKETLKNKNTF